MKSTATSEYGFWYPALRQPDDPVLPGMDRYPVKQLRRAFVPLHSIGHITYHTKLLCDKPKRIAREECGCTTGKSTQRQPPAVEMCPKCLKVYSRLGSSEMERLKAWNNGEAKVF